MRHDVSAPTLSIGAIKEYSFRHMCPDIEPALYGRDMIYAHIHVVHYLMWLSKRNITGTPC